MSTPIMPVMWLLISMALLGCAKSNDRNARALDRDTVRELLSTDTLWASLDVVQDEPIGGAVPFACDNLAAVEEGDGGQAERLRASGLVATVDSSSIQPDSVAHLCVYTPSEKLLSLAAKARGARPLIEFLTRPEQPGQGTLRVRTHLAELDSVTGIQQADGAIEAAAEFTVRKIPTEWGKRLGMADSVIRSEPLRARFDRYDDGWRLRGPR